LIYSPVCVIVSPQPLTATAAAFTFYFFTLTTTTTTTPVSGMVVAAAAAAAPANAGTNPFRGFQHIGWSCSVVKLSDLQNLNAMSMGIRGSKSSVC